MDFIYKIIANRLVMSGMLENKENILKNSSDNYLHIYSLKSIHNTTRKIVAINIKLNEKIQFTSSK